MSTGVNSIFRPAALLLAGRALGFVAAFGIPVVLTRIFPVSEFGTYKQVFLIYGTLLAIAQIGMAESLYYFLPANPENSGSHAANTLAVLGLAGLACLVLVWLTKSGIGSLFNNSLLPSYLPLAGIFLTLSLASILLEVTMTARKRFRAAAGTYAVSEVLRAGFFLVPVALFGSLDALLWGAIVFAILRFVATVFYLRKHFGSTLRPDWRVLRGQLAYALPFALAVTIEVAQGNLHLYAVGHYVDPALFAIYAVGCLQIPLVDLMMTSTSNVMMVRMQELRVSGASADVVVLWRDTTLKMALVFMPLVAVLVVLADPLIPLLYTRKYSGSVPVFMVGTLMILLTAFMTDSVLRVYAQTRYLVVLNLVRLGVVAGTIMTFMVLMGIIGAVVATVLATAVFKLLGLIRIRRLLDSSFSQILPWRGLLQTAFIAFAAALPALVAKVWLTGAEIGQLIVLLTSGVVYVAAYAFMFSFFAPLDREEKTALVIWFCKPLDRLIRFMGLSEKKLHRKGMRP